MGTIAVRYADGGSRGYKQIKIAGDPPRWVYLHRHMMAVHLGRPLKEDEAVKFKKGIDPLGDFTVEDLTLVTRRNAKQYERKYWLMRKIRQLQFELDQLKTELEQMENADGSQTS